MHDKAKKLAELGYVGFALDVYGKGKRGANNDENAKLMQPFINDRALLRKRLIAGYQHVRSLDAVAKNKIAVMGYCFGGLCALDLARSGVALKGAVSFHGLLRAPQELSSENIQAKVIAFHGHDDPIVPPEEILAFETEMTNACVDWQVHTFGNTMHAFTNPNANDLNFGTVYSANADRRSWHLTQYFLAEIFVD